MPPARADGPIFTAFKATQQNYSPTTEACSLRTVDNLLTVATTSDRPGMLLGKIQSGKTRAFVGAIAIAFDSGFDMAIVFTKGTKALTRQTLARLRSDLRDSIDNEQVIVHDIRSLPDNLSNYELGQKLVIVCKKEDDNLAALFDAVTDTYPELAARQMIVIDDEADFASIGYRRTAAGIEANVIPTQIDQLRQALTNAKYLQVTATPYALYLQPDEIVLPANGMVFRPVRPAFTELVPIHPNYIGGEFYFEESQDPASVASLLHVQVDPNELQILKRPDRRRFRIEDALTSDAISGIRRAIVGFLVGGWIRRWQQRQSNERVERYSFIVHTETGRAAHDWQVQVVLAIVDQLRTAATENPTLVRQLLQDAHADLSASLTLGGSPAPSLDEIVAGFALAVQGVMVEKVNSEKEIEAMLDESGQLRLRNPFNIFIGGQILDRGLTIDNLIGFFYGRAPQRAQQDTTLQHCRMYGNRPRPDLAVTRFYTTQGIYNRMRTIHEFDEALRRAFERGGQDGGVVFLRSDPGRGIVPCSPNRILLSRITTVNPNGRIIPVGFSTAARAEANGLMRQLDDIIGSQGVTADSPTFETTLATADRILDTLSKLLTMDAGREEFDWSGVRAAVQYLATQNPNAQARDRVVCLVRLNRNDRKVRTDGRLQNAPESTGDDVVLRGVQGDSPALLLYRNNGQQDRGWSGTPFYWPVVVAPGSAQPVIYAAETT